MPQSQPQPKPQPQPKLYEIEIDGKVCFILTSDSQYAADLARHLKELPPAEKTALLKEMP